MPRSTAVQPVTVWYSKELIERFKRHQAATGCTLSNFARIAFEARLEEMELRMGGQTAGAAQSGAA